MPSNNKLSSKRIDFNVREALNKNSWKKFKAKAKEYFVRDSKLEGFYIRVYASGTKVYGCYSRKGGIGRPIHQKIGKCEIVEFNEAKDLAKKYIHMISIEGINPKTKVREDAVKTKTLLDLAEDYIKLRLGKGLMKQWTANDYSRRMINCMPRLVKKPVVELSVEDVTDWWETTNGSRNNQVAFGYARKLFSQALVTNYVKRNIFSDAKELIGEFETPPPRTDHISKYDLENFGLTFQELGNKLTPVFRDFLVLLLVTGKRKGETESLTWSNINFEQGTITFLYTKTDKIDVVPMTSFTWLLLKSRFNAKNRHKKWVFPSTKPSKTGHITNPYKQFKKVREAIQSDYKIRPHDLRRSFSTATRELKISNEDLNILLNHSRRDVTEGYVFESLEYKRSNLERVEQYLNEYGMRFLNKISVDWYEGNNEIFDPEDVVSRKPSLDFNLRNLHYLDKYEKDFRGYGSSQWKPSKRLIKLGWKDNES